MLVIQTRNLSKVFSSGANQVKALQDVNLEVEPGEMISVVGSSGSGKSTLMNLVGCLDKRTSGSYWLDGLEVSDLDRNQLATIRNQKIGFVFQGYNLLPRTTALANVEMPLLYRRGAVPRQMRLAAREALERVGLADRFHFLPNELSGGQQQRVAIARALVTRPSILLADEPTGNLDSHMSVEILALFQKLHSQGHTILLVTHERDIVQYTRRTIELKDGLVIRDEAVKAPRHAESDLCKAGSP